MTDRILDFSESEAHLGVRLGQLVIRRPAAAEATAPLGDLAVVLVSHPQVTYTQAVLSGLAEAGGALVACNRKCLPVGMFLPLVSHFAQTERFVAQARAPIPMRKRLWQQIVRAKVAAQADTLERLYGTDHGLRALIPLVRSGDPSNVEARAARRYWPHLFDNLAFRRSRDNQDENLLLNYGYAVLRAIVARGICGVGLHPSLGIHHHNKYNGFCLADDLMEPFRPTVDLAVAEYAGSHDAMETLDPAAKRWIVARLTARYLVEGQQRTLFDVASRLAGSLVEVYLGKSNTLEFPEWRSHAAP